VASNNPDQCPKHPGTWDADELSRLRAAAAYAPRALPSATATLVARELLAAAELGWRAPDGLTARVAAELLALRAAAPPPTAPATLPPWPTPRPRVRPKISG